MSKSVNIKIERKHLLVFAVLVVFLVGVGQVIAVWNANNTVYHDALDVRVSIGGVYYSLQEAIDGGFFSSPPPLPPGWSECQGRCAPNNTLQCWAGWTEVASSRGTGCYYESVTQTIQGVPTILRIESNNYGGFNEYEDISGVEPYLHCSEPGTDFPSTCLWCCR